MRLQTSRAALCVVTLAVIATTVAAAQTSSAQTVSPTPDYSAKRNGPSILSASRSSGGEPVLMAAAESSLPDAPSATAQGQAAVDPPPSTKTAVEQAPQSPVGQSITPTFWAANGALLGSTIANAYETGNCRPSACQSVPQAIRTRGILYAIGIPASLGVTYISYRLKRGGTRMWIVPVALFTAGNIVYAAHAARYSNP